MIILATAQTILGAALLLIGLSLFVLAALGLVRFPDAYTRLTAVTKSGTLGICSILLGVLVLVPSWWTAFIVIAAIVLQLFTAPLGGFALSRGTYRSAVGLPDSQFNGLPEARRLHTEDRQG